MAEELGLPVVLKDFRLHVGREIRALRAEAGMSQAALARAVGVTQASISNYESGHRDIPLWVAAR